MSQIVNRLPLNGCMVLPLDVDHDGATADGERFDVEPQIYRNHARIEDVVIRFPDGRLQLVKRIIPAKHAI